MTILAAVVVIALLGVIAVLFGPKKPKPVSSIVAAPAEPIIAIWNKSSVVADAQAKQWLLAGQSQVSNDFAPLFNVDASLVFYSANQTPPAGAWQALILDNSDQANALGYHDVTVFGLPICKIFAKTDLEDGALTSVTLTHELLEMLADRGCNKMAQNSDTTAVAYEICDPVEDDRSGYKKRLADGTEITVTNFCTDFWFEMSPTPGAAYDFCRQLHSPYQLGVGGYIPLWDPANGGWKALTNGQLRARSRFELRQNLA